MQNPVNLASATDRKGQVITNSYNAVGNMTQTRPSVTVNGALSYGYDDLDRLTLATDPQVAAPDETFGYDPLGNRLNRDGQAVDSVFDAANRLIEDDDFTYVYDLNGNLVTKTAKAGGAVTGYTWDAEDRLARIDMPGGGFAEYVYDGLDRRGCSRWWRLAEISLYEESSVLFARRAFRISANLNWQRN